MKGHTKTAILLSFVTTFSFLTLVNLQFVSADSKEASVYVLPACSMTTTAITTHLYSLNVGSY